MENCIRQTEDEILTSVYNSALFQKKKTWSNVEVSGFFRKNFLKAKSIGNIFTGRFSNVWWGKSSENFWSDGGSSAGLFTTTMGR
jgi:hypothetical protein